MLYKSLYHELKSTALKHENKTAIIFGNHPITYKRLLDAIDRLASALSNLGVSAGDRVALLLPNIPQFVISFFAINRVGATAVPLHSTNDPASVETALRVCAVKGIIAWDRFFDAIQSAVANVSPNMIRITLGETVFQNSHNLTSLIADSEPLTGEPAIPGDWQPVIFHTAGASGSPKAVALSQQNLNYQIQAARWALSFENKAVVFGLLPYSGSLANIASMVAPLLFGYTAIPFARIEWAELIAALHSHQDILLVAPAAILKEMIQKHNDFTNAPNLLAALCVDTQLSAACRFEFQEKFGAPVIQGYGLTEAGPFVSVYDPRYHPQNESVGFPSIGFQIKIVDAQNCNVDIDTVGEILIQSEAVAREYLSAGEPNPSPPLTSDGWFRTGDLGKFDALGHLYVVGRKQDLIVKGGFEIYPNEIKALLTQHPKVQEAAIIGVRDEILGQEIKALVTLANGNHVSKDELAAYCRQNLPAYKCPKFIDIVHS